MNPARYKLLLSYLPSMASIVNSFQAPDVQRAVYDQLMEALNVRLDAELQGVQVSSRKRTSEDGPIRNARRTSSAESDVLSTVVELTHDLAEGDSIHAVMDEDPALP